MNNDPWNYVTEFEKALSEYTGAPYVITTDCATHAMELCIRLLYSQKDAVFQVPKHTYLSVPMMLDKIGMDYIFVDYDWEKYYYLQPSPIIDGSVFFRKNCYIPDTYYCVSFQHKKRLNLGRGGAILTDNLEAYKTLIKMRYDGRNMPLAWHEDSDITHIGYHYYLTPELAEKGLSILKRKLLKPYQEKTFRDYPDLTKYPVFRHHRYVDEKDNNGYHNFLYAWRPKKKLLIEIYSGQDATEVRRTIHITKEVNSPVPLPYISQILYHLYDTNTNIVDEFTDDIYFFSVNHNKYLRYFKIEDIFPDTKSVKIFEIESLWTKQYPAEVEKSERAVRDFFNTNETNEITYSNIDNVNEFSKRYPDIDVTYFICENNIEDISADYIQNLSCKVKNFNFYLLTQIIDFFGYQEASYPKQMVVTENPYHRFLRTNAIGNRPHKILNLNRRATWHRHYIASVLLHDFQHCQDRLLLTWKSPIRRWQEHPLNGGKTDGTNFYSEFLNQLGLVESSRYSKGESLMKDYIAPTDPDVNAQKFFCRFVDTLLHYEKVTFEIISESQFFGPLGECSEKSVRPIFLGVPFILVGGPKSFKSLERLGFKSYDEFTGYNDNEKNHIARMKSLTDFTEKLSSMDDQQFKIYMDELIQNCKPIIKHNQDNLLSGNAIEEFKKWTREIHQ